MCTSRSVFSLGAVAMVLAIASVTDATAQVKMYWSAYETHNIRRADLNGSNVEDVIPFANFPRSLFVHGGKIYWSDLFPPQIWRANTDGSNIEIIITERYALGMTFAEDKIYYSHRESNTDSIFRANLDGQEEELLIEGLDRRSVLGITVGGEKLYVTDKKTIKFFGPIWTALTLRTLSPQVFKIQTFSHWTFLVENCIGLTRPPTGFNDPIWMDRTWRIW